MTVEVYIGLGSNLNEPLEQLKSAIEYLDRHNAFSNLSYSSFYKSKPMGPQHQPDYINAVAKFHTVLSAELLLDELQSIENKHGRIRSERWGARTLDLDILLYGDQVMETPRLTVPHYGLKERNFVLYPLKELTGDNFYISQLGELDHLIQNCSDEGLHRL